MVKILPPVLPDPPVLGIDPELCIAVLPSPHSRFVDDFEYYDQLGRDPFQQNRIWLIDDPTERVTMVRRVLEKYTKQKHRRQMLFDACVRGDEAVVRCLVDTGLKVHPDMHLTPSEADDVADDMSDEGIPDIDDRTVIPLHAAANRGRLGCVKIILESGVGIDVRDEMGRTPLVAAAHGRPLDVMRYLLDAGADPMARTYADDPLTKRLLGWLAGSGALEMAASNGNVEALELLFERIERKEKMKVGDWSTLILPLGIKASVMGGCETFKLLLNKAAYPTEDRDGKTKGELLSEPQRRALVDATELAAELGSLETLKLLLSYQYPTDKHGDVIPFEVPKSLQKPFVWGAYTSIRSNQPDKFEFIYSLGVKEHESMSLDDLPEGQTWNIQYLLEAALEGGSIDSVQLLIEKYGAQPDHIRIPPGIQPLYVAAGNSQTDMVRYLLENHKPDIHVGSGRYTSGPTALWIAIQLKSLDSIALLLQHGGPLDHIDDDMLYIDQPTNAILRTTYDDRDRPVVSFEIWSPEEEHFAATQGDFQDRNPPYVRVELGPEDATWIRNLQYRRSYEELKEEGNLARMSDKTEEDSMSLDETDIRRHLRALPSVEGREKELNEKDKDLLPEWRPFLAPASHDE